MSVIRQKGNKRFKLYISISPLHPGRREFESISQPLCDAYKHQVIERVEYSTQ